MGFKDYDAGNYSSEGRAIYPRHSLRAAPKTLVELPWRAPGLSLRHDPALRRTLDFYNKTRIGRGDMPVGGSTPIDSEKAKRGEIVSIIRVLRGEIGELSNSNKSTVINEVMKLLKAIKAVIAKGTRASALINIIIHESWPIATTEAEDATEEVGADTDSDEKMTI